MGINWGPNGGRCVKRDKKGSRASATAGKDKGGNCIASSLDRFMAGYSRSYKYPGYKAWSKKKRG